MRFLTCVLTAIICSTALIAQPKLELQSEYDWGRVIPEGGYNEVSQVKAKIPLRNVGDDVLHITGVRPGCGCTSAPLEKDTLLPGEETHLDVTLNLPYTNGITSKAITVTTNEIENNVRVLMLTVDIQRALQLGSSFIAFNQLMVNQKTEGEARFTNATDQPHRIDSIVVPEGVTIITPIPVELPPLVETKVFFSYTPNQPGGFTHTYTLYSSIPGFSEFTLTAHGHANEPEALPISPVEQQSNPLGSRPPKRSKK